MGLFERARSAGSGARNGDVTYVYGCENCREETESPAPDPIAVTCPVCGSDCVSARPAVY